jgi:hypothetical protein
MYDQEYESDQENSLNFLKECKHEYIREGFCLNCGFGMGPRLDFKTMFYKGHMLAPRKTSMGYENEFSKIGNEFSEKLTKIVKDKLLKEKRSTREATRKSDLFCRFYFESVVHGEINPTYIAEKLGLDGKSLNKSLRIVSGTSRKSIRDSSGEIKKLQIVSISPVDCLESICSKFDKSNDVFYDLVSQLEVISSYMKKLLSRCPSLLNERPKYVAAGLIKHYCYCKDINYKDLGKFVEISTPTLNQYSSKMKKLLKNYKIEID